MHFNKSIYPRRRGSAFLLGLFTFIAIGQWFDIFADLDNRVARPVEFNLRHLLGADPKLDPRIKIYALGDSTVEYLGGTDISLKEWADLFAKIAQQNPKAVIIDRLFGNPEDLDFAPQFVERLRNLSTKIIAGSFLSPVKIAGRKTLNLNTAQAVSTPSDSSFFVYGPHASIESAFHHIGYLNYDADTSLRRYAFSHDGKVIFPPSFYLAEKVVLTDGKKLEVENIIIPEFSKNRLLVNLAHRSQYADNLYALKGLIRSLRDGEPLTQIEAGSVVVILPGMYTGNSDMHSSAYGVIPGGYIQVAMANSVLTKQWLQPIWLWSAFPYLAGLLSVLVAICFEGVLFWLVSAMGIFLIFCTAIFLFAFVGIVSPWLSSVVVFSLGVLLIFADRARLSELHRVGLGKEMMLGKATQELFLPSKTTGTLGAFTYATFFQPYGALSGDWLQIHSVGKQTVWAIGDVVGKGTSAALNTAVIASIFSQHLRHWQNAKIDIHHLIYDINATIHRLFLGKQFTTLMLAVLNEDTFTLYNFASPPWLKISFAGEIASVPIPKNNPLGIASELTAIRNIDLSLNKNEILLAHTDGLLDYNGSRRQFAQGTQKLAKTDAILEPTKVYQLMENLTRVHAVIMDDRTALFLRKN